MANITFYKKNREYYYVSSSGTGSQVTTSNSYCIRNNSSQNSWVRTAGLLLEPKE